MQVSHSATLYTFTVEKNGQPLTECEVEFAVDRNQLFYVNVWTINAQKCARLVHDEVFRGLPNDRIAKNMAMKGLVFPKKYPDPVTDKKNI